LTVIEVLDNEKIALENQIAALHRNFDQQRAEFEAKLTIERRKTQAALAASRDAQWTSEYYAEIYDLDSVRSITEQTHWPVRFLEFPHLPGQFWFNPSLAQIGSEDWLVTRRIKIGADHTQQNDIQFWKLTESGLSEHIDCALPCQSERDNYEDPRVFWRGRDLWLSACHFRPVAGSYAHQVLARLDRAFQPVEVIRPAIGKNARTISENTGHEKNWVWFDHDGDLHLVYLMAPDHYVVRTSNGAPVQRFAAPLDNPVWHHGLCRSSTPPIRVGDEYFCFFHSSTAWTAKQRRYHMGAYAFEAARPFRPTRMSTYPLLTGSEHDPRRLGMPLVVFPCGAVFRDNVWTVSLGVNDCACALLRIPHADLIDTLKKL